MVEARMHSPKTEELFSQLPETGKQIVLHKGHSLWHSVSVPQVEEGRDLLSGLEGVPTCWVWGFLPRDSKRSQFCGFRTPSLG